ncbi:hypothetical protein BKA65DRAFT_519524 [Rhexocercosporidium sp. MPI-PUGE-AT-0058]|nr:hypothetical protein BKA65DRAFT_519524 [Rhexocercosporidium sp. MPI-PUGE-AT-0058]
MQNNQAWNNNDPSGSPAKSDLKYARMKQVTKTAVRKFGPFLLTGLAAVAEHHWLKKDDEEEGHSRGGHSREPHSDRDKHQEWNDESEVRELREEVAKLRDDLKRTDRDEGARAPPPSSPRPPSLVRDPRYLHDEYAPREKEFVRMPFAPTPPFSFPAPFPEMRIPRPPQLYDPPSSSRSSLDRGFRHSRSRRRRTEHRHLSIPRRIPHHPDITAKAWHAGKVAAVAGLVEVLHVDDGKGDWCGEKGLRVGTTAAASFGSTYARERNPVDYRMREVVADVGTGVLVSRLVYGKARREDGRRPDSGSRRWTFCL